MRRSALAIVCLVAALVLCLAPAGAGAATPLTIGTGHKPGVAVDGAGTAYIAWFGLESNITSLHFCRLARGAGACEVSTTIAAPGTTLSRPFVTVDGSTVRVVSYRYGLTGARFDEIWEFTSTDRGATFDAGHAIGIAPFDEAVRGPGDTLTVATNAESTGLAVQNVPLDGTTAGDAQAILSTDHPYVGTVGLVNASTPLVVFDDGSSLAQFRRYSGAGSLNDPASWTPPVDLGYADYPRLAGGPSGLFLLAGTLDNALVVRKYNGTTFNAGVTVSAAGEDAQAHLTEDPGGRLHAVFGRGTADGLQLAYATSDDGVTWQSGVLLTQEHPRRRPGRHQPGPRAADLGGEGRRPGDADRRLLPGPLRGQAEAAQPQPGHGDADHGHRAQGGVAIAVRAVGGRECRGGEEEEGPEGVARQAMGQRQGQVPHHGQVQRRHGPRDRVAHAGSLRRDADQSDARKRARAGPQAPQDRHREGRAQLPGPRPALDELCHGPAAGRGR